MSARARRRSIGSASTAETRAAASAGGERRWQSRAVDLDDGEHVPGSLDPFQGLDRSILEADLRERTVDGHDLAGVQPDADVDPDVLHGRRDGHRAPDRVGGLGERGEETVTSGVLLSTPEPLQLGADDLPETRQDGVPATVAELRSGRRRADDVEEQDRREAPIGRRRACGSMGRWDIRGQANRASGR
jgi:hypothetical protein